MVTASTASIIADNIINAKGNNLFVVTTLALGKPHLILNELYRRAKDNRLEKLKIFTGLSFLPASPGKDLISQRFLKAAYDRIYDGCITADFLVDRAKGLLPENVTVEEFFYNSGTMINNEYGQQHYRSLNFAQCLDYIEQSGYNVFMNLVADAGDFVDFSSNGDFPSYLIPKLAEKPVEERPYLVCEVNRNLPVFGPDSQIEKSKYDAILIPPGENYKLIPLPSTPPSDAEYAIGIRCSSLVRDNGSLQIGIGRVGDALSWALLQRHKNNDLYRKLLAALQPSDLEIELVNKIGGTKPFEQGLHSTTELFSDSIMQLYDAGIVRREIDGFCINAGFWAGSNRFYDRLRHMDRNDRHKIRMRDIRFTNELFGHEDEKRGKLINARFFNQVMLFMLSGATCADALYDGRTVSGVGGQFEFVLQGTYLHDARSILVAPSTRRRRGSFTSNIVSSYGHTTIPRQLRDIVVTEYGIADLRYKTDSEVAAALIEISDSNFQDQLVQDAIKAKKLPKSYRIPDRARQNTAEQLRDQLRDFRKDGSLPLAPFGSEFDDIELGLLAAQRSISALEGDFTKLQLRDFGNFDFKAAFQPPKAAHPYLARLHLLEPSNIEETIARALVIYGLQAEEVI